MSNYLLTARSLTFAQRGAKILTKNSISATLLRSPRQLTENGCSYCLKISERNIRKSVEILRSTGLFTGNVYKVLDNGEYEKVIF